MTDEEFAWITGHHDRRLDDPSQLDQLEVTNDGEALAMHLHRLWCEEARRYGSPEAFAKAKIEGAVSYTRPAELSDIMGTRPFFMLSDEDWANVGVLVAKDRNVSRYCKRWFLRGFVGDPAPSTVSAAMMPTVRVLVEDTKNLAGAPPREVYQDRDIASVAIEIRHRFGCNLHSNEMREALSAATGLQPDEIGKRVTLGLK